MDILEWDGDMKKWGFSPQWNTALQRVLEAPDMKEVNMRRKKKGNQDLCSFVRVLKCSLVMPGELRV